MSECWINVWVIRDVRTGVPKCSFGSAHHRPEYARLAVAKGQNLPAFRLHVRMKGGAV